MASLAILAAKILALKHRLLIIRDVVGVNADEIRELEPNFIVI